MKNIRFHIILLFLLTSISFAENIKENKILSQKEPAYINTGKIEDYFRLYTGVDITDYGQPGIPRNISLLGLSEYHTLINLDGRKINSYQYGSANLNHIPIGLIKNIEIKKGISSAADSPNALGGSINILTSEPDSDIPYTRMYSRWGSSGLENYGINFKDQNGSLSYSIFADKIFSHGFGIYKKFNKYNAVNIYSKIDWYYSPQTWCTLTTGKYEDNIEIPYSGGIETDKNKDKNVQIKYETHQAKTALKIRFYGNDDWLEQNIYDYLYTYKNATQGNEEIIEQNIGKYHLIRAGKEHQWNKFYGNYNISYFRELVNTVESYYYEDEMNLNKLTVLFGQRHDINSLFFKEKSQRYKINYQMESTTALFLSAGEGVSFPSINDLCMDNDYYKGNPELITEKGWIYTLGLEKSFSDIISINLSGHFADINNFITWGYDSSLGYSQPGNIPSVVTKGAETDIKLKINKNFDLQAIYTYLLTENKETEKSLPYRPENKIKTNLSYKNIKHNGDLIWIVNLSHEYQGIRFADRNNSLMLNSFTNINVNISMILAKTFTLNLAANNIENKQYSLVRGYPMPASNYWGGIIWEFWN